MVGNIYITGEIGVNIELKDVIKQVQDQKEALEYNIYINSIGGYVDTGFDIYNYLVNLNKPITTIGTGFVASIATVIFLAGAKRKLTAGTQFMIHNPSGGIEGTAEQIENYNKGLKDAENNLIKFYSEKTGLEKDALIPLLRNETFLSNEEAISFGFTTETNETIKASFKINNNNKKNEMVLNQDDKNWFESLFSNFAKKFNKPKNVMLLDATGKEINFPSVEDGLNPQVGDAGEIDGQPVPDGTYEMPSLNNASVTFVGGVITEIVEVDNEIENLKKENEVLKQQNLELTSKVTETENKISEIENEFKNLKTQITGKFKFEVNKKEEQKAGIEISDRKKQILNKLKK